MYRTILLVIYLLVLIPSIAHLIRYREIPSSRRLSAGLGIVGVLLAPTAASLLCQLIASMLSIGLLLLIFVTGIGMLLKAVFR